jgi:hypothetical protein
MNIGAALTGVQRLYIETAPLIYYVEENPTYVTKMDAIIEAVEHPSTEAVSSVIILTEVLPQPMKLGNTQLERNTATSCCTAVVLNSCRSQRRSQNPQLNYAPVTICERRMRCMSRRRSPLDAMRF